MASLRNAGACVAAALALAGCGGGSEEPQGEPVVSVYVSAPLTGPARAEGQDVADGARLALAEADGRAGDLAVRAEYLDVAGRNESRFDAATAGANARTATEDSTAVAYIGEVDSGASRTSVPITNNADLLQIAPGSGATDLVRDEPFNDEIPGEIQTNGLRTFAMLMPTYGEDDRLPEPPPATEEFEAAFRAEFGRRPGQYAALGHEAMASALAAIERASEGTDRLSVVDAYFDGTERAGTAIGTYTLEETGEFRAE